MAAVDPSGEPQFASIEAEQQVLAALLVDNTLAYRIAETLGPEDFAEPAHQNLYRMIVDMIDAGITATPVTVGARAQETGALRDLGGKRYLVRLFGSSIQSSAIRDYADLVLDASLKRDLAEAMRTAHAALTDPSLSAGSVAARLEDVSATVSTRSTRKPLYSSHVTALTAAISRTHEASTDSSKVAVSTGIAALDKKLNGGFRAGQLIVLAGRPAMGKSTTAHNIALHNSRIAAGETARPTFFGTLEMEGWELAQRGISRNLRLAETRIPYSSLISGNVTSEEMRLIGQEAHRQQGLPIVYGEREVKDLRRFRSAVLRYASECRDAGYPLSLVVLDYVQRMFVQGVKEGKETINRCTDELKALAQELGIPVVVLSQLNREVERRDPPIPTLSDLKESGSLEEDADVVIFCFRPEYYLAPKVNQAKSDRDRLDAEADYYAVKGEIQFIVGKQRAGSTGMVRTYHDLPCNLIASDRIAEPEGLI